MGFRTLILVICVGLGLLNSCGGSGGGNTPPNSTSPIVGIDLTDSATNTGLGVLGTGVGAAASKITNRNSAGGALTCGGETDSENPFPCCDDAANAWTVGATVGNCGQLYLVCLACGQNQYGTEPSI